MSSTESHERPGSGTYPQPARVGLVLGAGGTVGCAYHAGVLFSLYHHSGWDARRAHTIVGTSAGSLVGALLRCGVAPDELALLVQDEASELLPEHLKALHQGASELTPSLIDVLLSLRLPSVSGTVRSALQRSPWPYLLSLTAGSRHDLQPLLAGLDEFGGHGWPDEDLRICTVAADTCQRRVLDRTSGVPLSAAVAASCAVPGVFRPQVLDGTRLVDGGIHSNTNADAVDFDQLDELWIIAPMAGARFRAGLSGAVFRRFESDLRRELDSAPVGMPIRIFTPHEETTHVMGIDFMANDRGADTVLASFLETGDALVKQPT